MPTDPAATLLDTLLSTLLAGAHALVPAGSARFEGMAWLSLAAYLVFAVTALHYALRPWAGRVLALSLTLSSLASLLLHGALQHSPGFSGQGPLWKFILLSQYLPYAVATAASLYLLHRLLARWRNQRP